MRHLLLICCLILGEMMLASSPLVFLGSVPENNAEVSSLTELTLKYDLSEYTPVVEEELGICYYGYYREQLPTKTKAAELYKGNPETGELIARISSSWGPKFDDWTPSSEFTLEFPAFQIEEAQDYYVVITLDVYAQIKSDTKNSYGDIIYKDNPMVLHFIGASNSDKVLEVSESPFGDNSIETIEKIVLPFNHPIDISNTSNIGIYEGETLVSAAEIVKVNEENSSLLEIIFPKTDLYYSHNYNLIIPQNTLKIINTEVVNNQIDLPIKGAFIRVFGVLSTEPRQGRTSLLDRINITYDFPPNGGIVYTGKNEKYALKIYKGEPVEENYVGEVNGQVELSAKQLVYYPEVEFEAGTEYTFVQEEDVVKAYDLDKSNPVLLPEYMCERIELKYSTPAADTLPKATPTLQTHQYEAETLRGIGGIAFEPYSYNDISYALKEIGSNVLNLVCVNEDGSETPVGDFTISMNTSSNTMYVNSGTAVNELLIKGKTYKFTIPANIIGPDQLFLRRYAANEAFDVYINGTAPSEFNVSVTGADGHGFTTVWPRNSKVTIDLAAAPGWEVKEVGHDADDDATVEGNRLTIDSLTKDINVNVAHELTEPVEFYDISTDVQEIQGTVYKIAREGVAVVITGLNVGDVVTVYTMSGYPMASHKAGADKLSFGLDSGIYVISINDVIFKIQI